MARVVWFVIKGVKGRENGLVPDSLLLAKGARALACVFFEAVRKVERIIKPDGLGGFLNGVVAGAEAGFGLLHS